MSNQSLTSLKLQTSSALSSHDPLYFASQPRARSEMSRPAASRLMYIANWKLSSESSKNEPRLRNLLGHISVLDNTRTFTPLPPPPQYESQEEEDTNELSTYLYHQVPSFKQFQTAIEEQLAVMAKVKVAAVQVTVTEYNSEEEEEEEEEDDDSDCESYNGEDWSDAETESDESLTDSESEEENRAECRSPTESCRPAKEEDDMDLWAIRPLTTTLRQNSIHF